MEIEKLPIELIHIGRIGKVRGIQGGLKLFPLEEFHDLLTELEYIFIIKRGNPVPIKIDNIEIKGNLLIFLNGIDNPNDAIQYAGEDIYINKKEFQHINWEDIIETDEYEELIGYTLKDEESGLYGKIVEIIPQEYQTLIRVNLGTHESYVPLVDEYILEIIPETLEIIMSLPEGVLQNKI